jgi:hypothetical protein
MIDPDALLRRTHDALHDRSAGAPSQIFLRRAVSDYYYAVFHELCRQAAGLMVGVTLRRDPRCVLVYRSIEHGRAKDAFRRIASDVSAAAEARAVATAFLELQEARHAADYNPVVRFSLSDVQLYFLTAESAMDTLRKEFDGKALLLTRLVIRERA